MCERCQRSVRALTIVRDLAPKATARRRRPGWAFAGASGLLAASVAVVALWSSERSQALAGLGAVNAAPAYVGAQMRAAPSENAVRFDSAMHAYARGDYAAAAVLLERGRPIGEDAAPADFFRGAALLMEGQNREAERALGNVIAAGPNPYSVEAYFYRAKARLRMGDRDGAESDLRRAAASEGPHAREAQRLLSQLGG